MRLIDADAIPYNYTNERGVPMTREIDIQNMPTIEPEQQWIPCSETEDLPKHEVLCCDKYGEELIGWLSYSDDQWLCESDCEMMYDPIAWRELPEPWEGEEHETCGCGCADGNAWHN